MSAHRLGVTVKAMADEFGVSTKTVRRDLVRLKDAGFPVAETTEAFGRRRWRIDGADPLGGLLGYDEAFALVLAVRGLRTLGRTAVGEAADSALRKILDGLSPLAVRYVERLGDSIGTWCPRGANLDPIHHEIAQTLWFAREERRVCFIAYRSRRSTEPLTYPVHVYAIREYRGSVYAIAYSEQHDMVRRFKLDRMSSAEIDELWFEIPSDFDADAYLSDGLGMHGGDAVPVRIRVAPAAARAMTETRWHPSQRETWKDNGSVDLTLHVAVTPELVGWVLSMAGDGQVIEPEELADAVKNAAGRIVGRPAAVGAGA